MKNKNDIISKWNAEMYDREETETYDVEFALSLIGDSPKRVLEIACGSGRFLVPFAKAGHDITGLDLDEATFEFLDEPLELRVGEGLLGRVFNGLGKPIDGYPEIISSEKRNVNGNPMNPYARIYPRDFIQTGISSIDGMNSLVRGQKLPIFSGNGLPQLLS